MIKFAIAAALAAGLPAASPQARAEVSEVRLSKQYGLPYLPFMVMEQFSFLEKQAEKQGLALKVQWTTLSNATAMMEAILSGQMDFIAPGVPTLATMWDKTVGTPNEIRAVSAVQSMPYVLVTRSAHIKSIRDFTDKDRIALPAVKLTGHAIALQMAAAKEWGREQYDKLDPITVSLSHPDAMAALFSNSEINAHYALEPYSSRELKRPGVHTVLNSDDTLGGQGTLNVYLTTSKFRQENPKIYSAFLNALREADEIIYRDERRAAELYVSKSKGFTVDEIYDLIHNKIVRFTVTPENTMKYADFLYKSGTLKQRPSSWKDLFFPEIHELSGS